MTIDQLEALALQLDLAERARLAERLLESLESPSDEENEQLWAEEAERRDSEMARGAAEPRPAHEVLRDLKSRFL